MAAKVGLSILSRRWPTSLTAIKCRNIQPSLLMGRRFLAMGVGDDETCKSNGFTESEGVILLSRPVKHVAHLQLNRPKVKNAFSLECCRELCRILSLLENDPSVRCLVLSGSGPDFTSGVDLKDFLGLYGQIQDSSDVARRAKLIRNIVEQFQAPFRQMHNEFCKPIISVIHGRCFGLGIELAACSDIRLCSHDSEMAIREVLIGIAADVGSLQLMPRLTANQGLLRELLYTGRVMSVDESRELGFVSRVYDTKQLALDGALQLAQQIATKSPVAVQGSKRNLVFSQDKPFVVGLDYNAVWNAAMMQGEDVKRAIGAILSRDEDEATFEDY